MQKFLPTLALVMIAACVSAQPLVVNSPSILAHTVLPTNPTPNSQVKIVTHLQTPSSAFLVDKQYTVNAGSKTIRLHLCYASDMLPVVSNHIDTFAVGQLALGVHTVQLDAYMSGAGQHCARIDSNFATFTILVGVPVGLEERYMKNSLRIYPNPAKDQVTVEAAAIMDVRIYTLQGQLVRAGETGTVPLRGLAAGVYLLEVFDAERKDVRRLIVQ